MKQFYLFPSICTSRSIAALIYLSCLVPLGCLAQTNSPPNTPIGEFLASQNQLVLRMEGVIRKTANPNSQNELRVASMAVQQANRVYKDSLEVPLSQVHSHTSAVLHTIEEKVQNVWKHQAHYIPERIAPEYELLPAFQDHKLANYLSEEEHPKLTHPQIKRLKAHTRTNFLVGVAFGSALMAIASLLGGML